MDIRDRLYDPDELLETIKDAVQGRIRTAIPVSLTQDSEDGNTATLKAMVKSVRRMPDGTRKLIELPILSDVPIHHAGGGDTVVTFPHKKGDTGVALICDRGFDAWEQQGGVQPQIDARMHNLSDVVYISGVRSKPERLKNVSKTSAQMRSKDGKHLFDMHPTNGPSMMADGGKHVVGVNPTSGISIKTAMALALEATNGMSLKGNFAVDGNVAASGTIGAPTINGTTGGTFGGFQGMMGGFVGALIGAGAVLMALAAQPTSDGVMRASYTLASLIR